MIVISTIHNLHRHWYRLNGYTIKFNLNKRHVQRKVTKKKRRKTWKVGDCKEGKRKKQGWWEKNRIEHFPLSFIPLALFISFYFLKVGVGWLVGTFKFPFDKFSRRVFFLLCLSANMQYACNSTRLMKLLPYPEGLPSK